jgi:hypothetical protein
LPRATHDRFPQPPSQWLALCDPFPPESTDENPNPILPPTYKTHSSRRIWHWCGNDPVREDIRRINLTNALTYLRVGDPIVPPDPDRLTTRSSDPFNASGWNISDYLDFEMTLQLAILK